MIISVDELREFIDTDKTDSVLQAMLDGAESFIVQYTNNDFYNRALQRIEYPKSIKMAVVDMMKWKIRNESQNSSDGRGRPVQSESISRHSVTYANDSTESDIDSRTGYPRKYTSILDIYKKARF